MLSYYILEKCYDIVIDMKKRYATIIELGNTTLLL